MGWVDTPFDVPNIRMESGEAQSHTRIGWFRSVNNVMHAWSTQSFVAEIAAQLGKDPKDFLLELIGPARIVDPRKQVTTEWWNYGEPFETYRDRHRAAAQGRGAGGRAGRLGQATAEGPRPRHRGASLVRQLHRDRGRGRGGRQGQHHGAARRHRGRLRLLRQSRTGALADRGRGRDGADPRQVWRDQLQGRARRAGQLQRLPDRADRRVADARPGCTSSSTASTCRRAASASPACRRSRRRCAMRSSRRPESASASCRSAISWRERRRQRIRARRGEIPPHFGRRATACATSRGRSRASDRPDRRRPQIRRR